jgi:hypothetical protein
MREAKEYLELAERCERAACRAHPRSSAVLRSAAEHYRLVAMGKALISRSVNAFQRVQPGHRGSSQPNG